MRLQKTAKGVMLALELVFSNRPDEGYDLMGFSAEAGVIRKNRIAL
jgi:hypothetical protein